MILNCTFIKDSSIVMSFLDEINKLPPPDDSKQFLTGVKKVLQDFKVLAPSLLENDVHSCLTLLIKLYLSCPSRLAAKRAMASFFQGVDESWKKVFESQLCYQLSKCLNIDGGKDGVNATTRLCVDNINSLMENFKLGEQCLFKVFLDVLTFLVQAERHFLSEFGPDVPPVHLNQVMLHCHVTMQTINLVLQKTSAECPEKLDELLALPHHLSDLMDLDIEIIHNDAFLLDCRCCCAMNVFLLLQLMTSRHKAVGVIPSLIMPKVFPSISSDRLEWLSDAQADSLLLDSAQPLTFLTLTFGYVAMVTISEMLHQSATLNTFFYLDVLLPKILLIGKSCDDTSSKSLYAKTVNLWTGKLLSAVENTSVCDQFARKVKGDSKANNSLLDYVWTHWEDQLVILHQSAKTVFENILKVHVRACSAIGEDGTPFILSLLDKVLNVSWSSRGKFSALISCVHHVGTHVLLTIRPSLPEEVLQQLHEQAVSCYASELYSCLFLSHQKEITLSVSQRDDKQGNESAEQTVISNSRSLEDSDHDLSLSTSQPEKQSVMEVWIYPIIKAMHSNHKKWKQNIIEYLLPKLMKDNVTVLDFIIEKMSSVKGSHSSDTNLVHGAIIMCMRRARAIGLFKYRPQTASNELWFGILHPSILKSAFCSSDEQTRLDAFALLCENCKTSETLSSFEFEMLQFFIPYNINSQSPAFRQTFLSLLKKLFFRVKESLGLLNRLVTKTNHSSSQVIVTTYNSFLSWLMTFLLDNLYPGSTFAQRTVSLASLTLMTTFFRNLKDGFSVPDHLTQNHVQSFLQCLADTFEENKKEALGMLTIYTNSMGGIGTSETLSHLLKISFNFACSTKPQDCVTAAYLFNVLLKQPVIWDILKYFQMDLVSNEQKLKFKNVNANFVSLDKFSNDVNTSCQKYVISTLYLLNMLCVLLSDEIEIAQSSLVTAAANRPMYPTLLCIRYILQDVEWNALTNDLLPVAKQFIDNLLHTCLNLAEVVSPVVQNSSPEGNVPMDAIVSPDLNISDFFHSLNIKEDAESSTMGSQVTELVQSVMLSQMLVEAMPEYLVVCCWRSIREVSLTLGKLCLQVPVIKIGDRHSSDSSQTFCASVLLSLDQVEIMGEYFAHQLLESIHRGAFELAYAGFQLMCQMLWSHPYAAFHRLPSQWLQKVMADIQTTDQQTKFCATRRSAGIPFFVQAITSTEPAATGRKCFHGCMKELLGLATNQVQVTSVHKDAQVHALNILRTLYRDSRLGEEVVPYVADGLKAAILGFKSDLWAVRNSATLLLSALMTRIFGVKRSKDESSMSMKNCQTGRSFFHRYPSLYPFLLDELEIATDLVSRQDVIHLHPSLYPILLVLGRLFPSTLEGTDTSLSLSAFIPFVLKCASSPVYKTRIMAANALQPLAKRGQVTEIIEKLLDNFYVSEYNPVSTSLLHGSLLQLHQLMKLVDGFNSSLKEKALNVFASKFIHCSWLLSSKNLCFTTRQEALKLVDTTLDVARSINFSAEECKEKFRFLRTCFMSSLTSSATKTLTWKPFFYEFEKIKASLIMKHLIHFESFMQNKQQQPTYVLERGDEKCLQEDQCDVYLSIQQKIVLELLNSPCYEVRLEALKAMVSVLNVSSTHGHVTKEGNVCNIDEDKEINVSQSETREHIHHQAQVEASQEFKTLMIKIATCLFDSILKLAMETEDHHMCIEQVFQLLAVIPECSSLLFKRGYAVFKKIFINLLQKIKMERRTEVKASMLRFSSCIVPLLHDSLKSTEENQDDLDLLMKWIDIQTSCSRNDADPDLQMSVAFSLFENASILLRDPCQKLGTISLLMWDILAILLQADDLEVKDIASSALAVVHGQLQDAVHPSYALHKLPEFLLVIKGKLGFNNLFKCLVSWILLEQTHEKESEERLFERGEMNTYWDQIAFSRSVAQVLRQLLNDLQNNSTSCFTDVDVKALIRDLNKTELEKYITSVTYKLVHELEVCKGNGNKSDVFSHSGKHASIWHMIYHAETLKEIFQKCQCLNVTLPSAFPSLEKLLTELKENFHIYI